MTRSIGEAIARGAIAADASGRGLALGEDDWKLLALDMDLNAQGLAFVGERKRKGAEVS